MSILHSTVTRRQQLGAAKKLIEVYLVCNDIGYHDSDLNLLAYYCLFGPTKTTNLRIQQEYYPRLEKKNACYSIWKTRSKLKKLGLLIQNVYTLELSVKPELLAAFEEKTKLGYLINFRYEELETDSGPAGHRIQPAPEDDPAND
ncbi:hypothetical protein [Spirosoma oryzae]|uniref:hypothetical protein n=1 Tax=Spirosoma oryzae TaxID=1469603 RepID=UPI000D065A42|nr:hypothetical protein [Spirosoma oryzae]